MKVKIEAKSLHKAHRNWEGIRKASLLIMRNHYYTKTRNYRDKSPLKDLSAHLVFMDLDNSFVKIRNAKFTNFFA